MMVSADKVVRPHMKSKWTRVIREFTGRLREKSLFY